MFTVSRRHNVRIPKIGQQKCIIREACGMHVCHVVAESIDPRIEALVKRCWNVIELLMTMAIDFRHVPNIVRVLIK